MSFTPTTGCAVSITIPAGTVASNLTNFPVFIRLSDLPAAFWDTVSATGGDLRANTADGSALLPIDVVAFDALAQTGAVFVNVPTVLAAAATEVLLTWDGTSAALPVTDAHGRNAVWADYHRVFFLNYQDELADHAGHGTAPALTGNVSTFVGALVSPETSSHQGVAWDGTYYYTIDTNKITKWSAAWAVVATNTNPVGAVGAGVTHCGDPEVVGTVLYVPMENYTNVTTWSGMRIARFRTSDLTLIDSVDISAQGHEAASLAYCADDGYLYLASYADGTKLLRFTLSTLAYVSTLTLSGSPANTFTQGLTYWRGKFFAVCNTTESAGTNAARIVPISRSGVIGAPVVAYHPTGSAEGIGHTPTGLLHTFSTGIGQGKVWLLTPRTFVAGGGAEWRNPAVASTPDESSAAIATGLTRFTQWTIGLSALITDKGLATENFINYGVSSDTGLTNRTGMGWRQATDRFGLWNNADTWLNETAVPAINTTYRFHDLHDGTSSRKLYKNGALVATDLTITAMPGVGANALFLGTSGADITQALHGSLGYIYLRAGLLSADWIAAEYANLSTPPSFYSIGVIACAPPPILPGWRLTIGGVDKTAVIEAFSMTLALNDRARARVTIAEELPTRYAELMAYAADGVTPLFGGLILQRHYVGRTPAKATFTAELECGDWFTYADWVYTSASYAVDVSLRTVLVDLVADHLSQYGITLDPAQITGPTLAPFTWANKRAADALRELSDRTGYVVGISPAKVLRMFVPMTEPAPFSLTETATHCRDVTWRDSDRTPYNAVTLLCGPGGLSEVDEERHNGDGVRRRWKLYAPFSQIIGGLITGSDATGNDPGGYNVGIFGEDDIPWTVDLATNEVVQRADQPVRAVGEYFLIWYTAAFPFTVRVTSGATPVVEYAEARPDVRSEPVAIEIANGLLASFQAAPRELSMTTDVDGLDPGQALVVDLPALRGVSGTFLVTSVSLSIAFDRVDGRLWRYAVEAVESGLYQGSYLDDWRKIAGIGGGSSGSVTGGGETSGALSPHHATHETGGTDEVLFPVGLTERGRTEPMGEWIDVPYNAADYAGTGGMTWTVEAGDVGTNAYTLIGRTLIWNIVINDSLLSGTASAQIQIAFPAGVSVARASQVVGSALGPGGWGAIFIHNGSGHLTIFRPVSATFDLGFLYLSVQIAMSLG